MLTASSTPQLHRNPRRRAEKHAWIGRFVPNHRYFRSSPVVRFMGYGTTRPILNSTFTIPHSPALPCATPGFIRVNLRNLRALKNCGPGTATKNARSHKNKAEHSHAPLRASASTAVAIGDWTVRPFDCSKEAVSVQHSAVRWSRIPIRDPRVDDSHRHSRGNVGRIGC